MKISFQEKRVFIIVPVFLVLILVIILLASSFDFQNQTFAYGKTGALTNIELRSQKLFVGAPGSTLEYNIYLENTGKSFGSCNLTASSNQGYAVEVWRDIDNSGQGDQKLLPPQGVNIELDAGEVATLIVKVMIPYDELDGVVDVTTINVENSDLGIFEFINVQTTIFANLPFPSNWVQFGSDIIGDSIPERADSLALYYTNNGSHIFFRIDQTKTLDPLSFSHLIYVDVKSGGQQIGNVYYDFIICSDEIIWEWDGMDWVESGYPSYLHIEGTSTLLWADFGNLGMEMQDIQILSWLTTKNKVLKDEMGPYMIPRDNISEVPLAFIPIVALVLYLTIYNKFEKIKSLKNRLSLSLSNIEKRKSF
jgi:hypothetical protein